MKCHIVDDETIAVDPQGFAVRQQTQYTACARQRC